MGKRTVEVCREDKLLGSICAEVLNKPVKGCYGLITEHGKSRIAQYPIYKVHGKFVANID